jgi:zinc protease
MPMVLIGYHAPAFSPMDSDSAALEVLAELVFAERSPLFRRLVLDEQKVEHLEGDCERHVDPNLFTILARVKNAKDVPYVEQAIYRELARVASEGADDKTLREVVARARYAFAGRLSTADHTALLGAEFLALTGGLLAIDETFARLSQITAADIKRVARKYFTPDNRTVVVLEPEAG